MKIIDSVTKLKKWRRDCGKKTVGFVPTMGALHAGHSSLVNKALKDCQIVAASIFVNPTQFNDPKDLERYPRPIKRDLAILKNHGVDAVFMPNEDEIYHDKYRFQVHETELSQLLCGRHRPGHFTGVLSVVLKLFQIVKPTHAYFGEKDYQQLRLIEDMAKALFLDLKVVRCPTVREADGLAMSSRNIRLSQAARVKAPLLYTTLISAPNTLEAERILMNSGFKVEYVEEHWGRRFAAAKLGDVRLIDNVEI